jgi:hypothetical protein
MEGAIHPTQKPIKLYDFCFEFSKLEEGSKVLDTHLGSVQVEFQQIKTNYTLSVVKLTRNILTNKTKDMRNLSVRLVYGRRSVGIAPNSQISEQ